jgi:predicted GTPase
VLVINKIDTVEKETLLDVTATYTQAHEFDAVVRLSAKTGHGVNVLLDELQKAILDLTKVEEIIKEIEKIVEVAPKDPYCNISMHYVWPILFFISLALNVGFIVLIIVYFARKKKNQTDDTPLVDYDIADDVAGDETP